MFFHFKQMSILSTYCATGSFIVCSWCNEALCPFITVFFLSIMNIFSSSSQCFEYSFLTNEFEIKRLVILTDLSYQNNNNHSDSFLSVEYTYDACFCWEQKNPCSILYLVHSFQCFCEKILHGYHFFKNRQ